MTPNSSKHDPLHTRLCEEYGCRYPIVALTLERQIAVEVTNAGGIGVLAPEAHHTPERVREDIRWIKERVGDRPYGVDLVIPASFVEGSAEDIAAQLPREHVAFVEQLMRDNQIAEPTTVGGRWGASRANLLEKSRAKLEVVFEEHVPIFVSGLGSPAFMLERAHAQGMKVWGLVGMTRQAKREIEAGIDLVIAQGQDAGAHVGKIGTFSLVSEVVEVAGDTPVLAAGGVSTGKHLLGALALGAAGVWAGTIWQATEESTVDPYLKQQLLDARAEDAIVTRARTGKTFRQLRNKWTEAWDQPGAPDPLQMPLQQILVGRIMQAIDDHRVEEWMSLPAGQGAGAIRSIRPTRQVVADLVADARATFAAMMRRRENL